jgi:phenylalanyl-tRNA synthetase beta chain
MNISYNWLKRYIDFDYEPHKLAAVLTSLGLECDTVEEVESIRGGLRGLVAGKVLTCIDHPDSDHLHVTTVDVGSGEPLQIVCGAPNVAAGQTVIVATIGTVLYDGDKEFKIKKSKMRGVESFGMICAEDEIGLGASHDGIMVLSDDIEAGTPAAEIFNVGSDYMLEVELTPNRVDAASHYGTARDLKAHLACESYAKDPKSALPVINTPSVEAFASDRTDGAASVEVVDAQGAPRYSGVTIRGVEVKESPDWLKKLLVAAGQRPINNIVDITNFILLGLGQPLHCFDLGKVAGEKIVVRTCPTGTEFVTLDSELHKLDEADLMICDAEKPMCLAGVFGGLDSGVTEQTHDIFIESAWFNPTRVRRTARRHGLSTDASFRYERGTDPEITVFAAKLAALMVKELAGGEICGSVIDIYPEPVKHATFDFSLDYCDRLIGKSIPKDLICRILEALEIKVEQGASERELKLDIPPYRVDVTRPCDVVEEVLRVYGYNNVEFGTEMHLNLSQKGATDESYELRNLVSEQLTGEGFAEILNNSLSSASYYAESEKYPLESCVSLMNPLSSDLSVLRRTLLYGGLESMAHNLNRKNVNLRFYEFGNIYHRDPSKTPTLEDPLSSFTEEEALGLWMTGDIILPSWQMKGAPVTFYDLRATVDRILSRLGVPQAALVYSQESDEMFSAKLTISTRSGKSVGEIGILSQRVLHRFDIDREVVFAQILWKPVFKFASKANVTFAQLPKTQAVRRDLALLIDKTVKFSDVEAAVTKAERKLLRSVELFDVYEGKNLPAGKKSYAICIMLQDTEKTLTDKQIEMSMQRIIDALRKDVGAELR